MPKAQQKCSPKNHTGMVLLLLTRNDLSSAKSKIAKNNPRTGGQTEGTVRFQTIKSVSIPLGAI